MNTYTFLLLFALLTATCHAQAPQDSSQTKRGQYDGYQRFDRVAIPINMREISRKLRYPEEARLKKLEGEVRVNILVNEQGIPVRHEIIKSPHPVLTKAVEAVIYDMRFTPAMRDNAPVPMWVPRPFHFSVKKR